MVDPIEERQPVLHIVVFEKYSGKYLQPRSNSEASEATEMDLLGPPGQPAVGSDFWQANQARGHRPSRRLCFCGRSHTVLYGRVIPACQSLKNATVPPIRSEERADISPANPAFNSSENAKIQADGQSGFAARFWPFGFVYLSAITINFRSVMSSMEYRSPSRPSPDSLMPP